MKKIHLTLTLLIIIFSIFTFNFFDKDSFIDDTLLGFDASKLGYKTQTINKGDHYYLNERKYYTDDYIKYSFAFDRSFIYKISNADGSINKDHYDWNKLAGFSDCGSFDLSKNGAMFAWRYNLNGYIEVSAYRNVDGKHLYSNKYNEIPMFKIQDKNLDNFNPINYKIEIDNDFYLFTANGIFQNGEIVSYDVKLPRGCKEEGYLKKFAQLYFGGTKPAPHVINGYYKDLKPNYTLELSGLILTLKTWIYNIF